MHQMRAAHPSGFGHPNLLQGARFAFDCWLFAALWSTFSVVWCTQQRGRACRAILFEGLPKSEARHRNRERGPHDIPLCLSEDKLLQDRVALAHAFCEADQLLLPSGVRQLMTISHWHRLPAGPEHECRRP